MGNLGALLAETARHHGDHAAVRFGSSTLTYRQLDDRVDALAAGLLSLGVRRGDRVAVLAWNRPEVIEVMFAVFKLGLVLVPLNARYTAGEVAYHLTDPGVGVLVHGPEFESLASDAVGQAPSVRHVLAMGGNYEEVVADQLGAPDATVDVDPGETCWLFYTSGTTGRPKGAMLTHANLLFVVLGWVADLTPLTPDSVVLHAAPLSHGAGFHALAAVAKGATQVIPASTTATAAETLDLLADAGITDTWMVPTQITRLVAELEERRREGRGVDLPHLTSVVYGGAPFHVEDLVHAIEVLGPVLVQLYGQGETPMTATHLRHGEHRLGDPTVEERLASAGHPRTGMEVRVVDADDRPVGDGEPGEVVVRGPAVMLGYWGRPEETEETLRGGWLHTGDLGTMRHGYLYLLDRMKDLIISGGSNVYAREVEEVLIAHPSVLEVAVIGVPDRDWGERVVAAVVPATRDGVAADLLAQFAREQLASYKRPKEYVVMDSLPRSPYGKVLKRDLRAALVQDGPADPTLEEP